MSEREGVRRDLYSTDGDYLGEVFIADPAGELPQTYTPEQLKELLQCVDDAKEYLSRAICGDGTVSNWRLVAQALLELIYIETIGEKQ